MSLAHGHVAMTSESLAYALARGPKLQSAQNT